MNDIIYLSSDEEDDKLVYHSDAFDDEKPKRTDHRKPNSSDVTVEDDGDDEDCVVLDGDPYKTTEKETTFHTCETDDDILVVGTKGEIACRDFPHARHACAKYPFNSTSHDKYCDMCHCYACDIRAPCLHWCIGISTIDHCHANDKELTWKNQREGIRTGKLLPPQTMLQNTWYSSVNQFGPSTIVTSGPNTYTRPGYRPEQPRTFPQNPALQSQLYQNQNGRFNNGNSIPQALSSKSLTWTQQRPSLGVTPVEIAQGYSRYVTPPTALQGNSQQTFGDYVSTLTSSHTNMYGRKCSGKTRSYNAQTSAVPFGTQYPPARQQQQQQQTRSNEKVLSEIEDWLMDSDPVCPVPGQVNSTKFQFGFETFFR